jgi:hypothetical protein
MTDTMQLLHFIAEREQIRIRRANGEPKPWTDDKILGTWSFCNVRREDDRVTRWVAENWRTPHADDPDVWFAMAVARLVNWPDSLAELGYPVPWDRERFVAVLQGRAARGETAWGSAYNISNGGSTAPKAVHIAGVLDKLWQARATLRPRAGERLAEYHGRLMQRDGLASFMAAQIVADLKYVEPLRSAADWSTFAASGPGSRRGLNRVLGQPVDAPWQEADWRKAIRKMRDSIAQDLQRMGLGDLHAQDLQNCLCETDKMMRVKLGEGKPKRKFVPHETNTATTATTTTAPSLGAATVLEAAMAYAAGGLPVFPCVNSPNEERHKRPLTAHGFKDATTDEKKIRRWWSISPDALIGMPTGKVSGIAVLDLDKKKGQDATSTCPTGRSGHR